MEKRFSSISCTNLYNMLQDSTVRKLVVAICPLENFEDCSIRNSVLAQFENGINSVSDLRDAKCMRYAWDSGKAQIKESNDWSRRGLIYKNIILYDEDGNGPSRKVAELLLEEMKVEKDCIFCLEGGLSEFKKKYDFLISSKTNSKKGN